MPALTGGEVNSHEDGWSFARSKREKEVMRGF